MLFVALLTLKPGANPRESNERRLQWQYPEGSGVVAEYWLQTHSPSVIVVAETDDVASIMGMIGGWDDLYDITVAPAVTAEEGLKIAKQMMEMQK